MRTRLFSILPFGCLGAAITIGAGGGGAALGFTGGPIGSARAGVALEDTGGIPSPGESGGVFCWARISPPAQRISQQAKTTRQTIARVEKMNRSRSKANPVIRLYPGSAQ